MSRQIDVSAAEFATVRAVLGLSQGAFALRLGIARRTVIRGEQRGIELPSRYGTRASDDRRTLRDTWDAAKKEAESQPARYVEAAESPPLRAILENMAKAPQRHNGYYYGEQTNYSVDTFRAHVKKIAGDIKTRAKVSPGKGKSRKKKLARRKK